MYINFDTNKATLKEDGLAIVNEIAKLLKLDPTLKISINGYTDNTGSKEHNLKLSKERAVKVAKTLIELGIPSGQLRAKGYGQNSPIVDNNTEEGRAKNRRVELVKI